MTTPTDDLDRRDLERRVTRLERGLEHVISKLIRNEYHSANLYARALPIFEGILRTVGTPFTVKQLYAATVQPNERLLIGAMTEYSERQFGRFLLAWAIAASECLFPPCAITSPGTENGSRIWHIELYPPRSLDQLALSLGAIFGGFSSFPEAIPALKTPQVH